MFLFLLFFEEENICFTVKCFLKKKKVSLVDTFVLIIAVIIVNNNKKLEKKKKTVKVPYNLEHIEKGYVTGNIKRKRNGNIFDPCVRLLLGALALPRWPSQSGLDSGLRGSVSGDDHSRSAKTLEQSLLTTCVGTIGELHELLQRVTQFHFRHSAPCPGATPNGGAKQALTWASSSLHALFYFMRCSQVNNNLISFKD